MRETQITLPELGLVAGTRAAFGAGLALLLGDRLSHHDRKLLGWSLLLTGAATTIPLVIDVLGRSHEVTSAWWEEMEMTHDHPGC